MSRENFDIPEVFRRAMEEAGWRGEGGNGGGTGGDDPGGGEGPRPSQASPVKFNRSLWIIGLLFILLISFNWVVNVYTDWLWFNELAYESVWVKQWAVRIGVFAVSFLIATLMLVGNWLVARRRAIRDTSPFMPQFLTPSGIGWLIAGCRVVSGIYLCQWRHKSMGRISTLHQPHSICNQ